jgi:hypothetical protein
MQYISAAIGTAKPDNMIHQIVLRVDACLLHFYPHSQEWAVGLNQTFQEI